MLAEFTSHSYVTLKISFIKFKLKIILKFDISTSVAFPVCFSCHLWYEFFGVFCLAMNTENNFENF